VKTFRVLIFLWLGIAFVANVAHAGSQAAVEHFLGSIGGEGSRDGKAAEARFWTPEGIWSDGVYVYVADRGNAIVRRISRTTGDVVTIAGSPQQYVQVDATGSDARFSSPHAVWGTGASLYVADGSVDLRGSSNGALRKIVLATREVKTIAHFSGSAPTLIAGNSRHIYLFAPTVASGGIFGFPGVLVRALYEISIETEQVRTMALPPAPSNSDADPKAIWADDQFLYLAYAAAQGAFNLAKIDLSNEQFTAMFAFPPAVPRNAFFPSGLWRSERGNFFVTDSQGIYQVDSSKNQLSKLAIAPAANYNQIGGLWGNSSTLFLTDSVADIVFTMDMPTLQVMTLAGLPDTTATMEKPGSMVGPVVSPEEFGAQTIWGNDRFIYAAARNAIYKISRVTREITLLAGSFTDYGLVDGDGPAARFNLPTSLWGLGQDLYVLDYGNQLVRKVDVESGLVMRFTDLLTTQSSRPSRMWGDGAYLYITETGKQPDIRRINIATHETTIIPIPARNPVGISTDRNYAYVADFPTISFSPTGPATFCEQILKTDLTTGDTVVLAGGGITNESLCSSVIDGVGAQAQFVNAYELWSDGRLLYVLDRFTLRTVDPRTGETHTIAGDSHIHGHDDGIGSQARFASLTSAWGDGQYLYVADGAIRRVTLPVPPAMTFGIKAGGADYWRAASSGNQLQVGYAHLQQNGTGGLPQGVAIFSYRANGVLISEASVPGGPGIQQGRIFAEIGTSVNTGLAIANPNDITATVSFYFTDGNGVNFGNSSATIQPNAQIAAFLNEAPFNGSEKARSFSFTSSVPVGAIALRGHTNERSEFLMTTLPVASISSSSVDAAVLPQFAKGGGWQTQVLLVNPTDETLTGAVQFEMPMNYSIPPRSSAKIVTSDLAAEIHTGAVHVYPASGSKAPVASTVFSFVQNGITVTESGAAATGTASAFRVFAEYGGSLRTGVAVANVTSGSATLKFELLNMTGEPSGYAGLMLLAGNGHSSIFIDEIPGFVNLPASFRGVLRVSSDAAISVIGLRGRYNERGDFLISTTPALPEDTPSPTDLIFPHFVTGGGYTTEFLLLNTGGSTSGSAFFRTQSGSDFPFPVTR